MYKKVRMKVLLAIFKFKRIVARFYGTTTLDYPKKKLRITTSTIREFDVRARSVHKEPETVAWIESESAQGGTLYDIGANVGAYSLIGAVCGFDVVAFEPAPQNYAALHENVSLNGLDTKITSLPIILGERNYIHTFSFYDYSRGATEGFFSNQLERGVRKPMLVSTLDALIDEYGLSKPSIMKIDVDGGEVEVLRGAERILRDPGLRSILIEVEDANRDAVHALLTEARFARISEHNRIRGGIENLIYART
jgi:FkbM family methyltransferase